MKNKEILKALVGSHNYGLNTPSSDRDYKIFVLPTFDDLYCGNMISTSSVKSDDQHEDKEVKDIRLLMELLRKSNPAYLEILYSIDVETAPVFADIWGLLLSHREDIIQNNLLNLFNACWGTMCEKAKSLRQKKFTQTNKKMFDKLGYDPKNLCHFFRMETLLESYLQGSFNNCFGKCLSLEVVDKSLLLDTKSGKLCLTDSYEELITNSLNSVAEMKKYFVNTDGERSRHKELFAEVNEKIKSLIKKDVCTRSLYYGVNSGI